jgi:hypothetical protein
VVHREIHVHQVVAYREMEMAVHRLHQEEGKEDRLEEGTASRRVAASAYRQDRLEMGEDRRDRALLGLGVLQ